MVWGFCRIKLTEAEFLKWQQEAENENTSGDRLAELVQISTALARVVAKNPNTPSEVLRSLSESDDTETRQKILRVLKSMRLLTRKLGVKHLRI
jgi:hypothetical protein